MGNLLQVQLKAFPSLTNSLTEYMKGDGRHSEHVSLLKEWSHLRW